MFDSSAVGRARFGAHRDWMFLARFAGCLMLVSQALMSTATGETVETPTPYGKVSLPYPLHQVPGLPVYYLLGLSGVPSAENEGHTSNAGFVVTSDGVVVYDAGGTPAVGYMLLKRIREVTEQPVRIVIAGHYHADHVYGLQAFKEHTQAVIWAQERASDYIGGADVGTAGEDSQRRLEQRREALWPWVDQDTYVVAPDRTFAGEHEFKLGGLTFELKYMGAGHSPSDIILIVRELGVVFSGDLIFKGRVPFLDSPETDTEAWLEGLDYLAGLDPAPSFIVPGHGGLSDDPARAITLTKRYIQAMREAMADAVDNFVPFNEAYAATDWSEFAALPAFEASNRGNAYRVYLEMEAESLR